MPDETINESSLREMLAWPRPAVIESQQRPLVIRGAVLARAADGSGIEMRMRDLAAPAMLRPDEMVTVRVSIGSGSACFSARVLDVRPSPGVAALIEMPDQAELVEQRRASRVPVSVPLPHVWMPGAGDLVNQVICTDISTGGMQIEVPTPVASGSLLRADLPLPGGSVTVAGTVRWSRKEPDGRTACGVRFLGLSAIAERALHELVRHLTQPETVGRSRRAAS